MERSKVITPEQEAKIIAKLPEADADVVRLLAATGMHLLEALRFAKGGDVLVRGTQVIVSLPSTKHGNPTQPGRGW